MKIQQALLKSDLPLSEKEILLSKILAQDRSFLAAFPEVELNLKQEQSYNSFLKRREKSEPLAYILGYKDFFGRRFLVNKNVLIPREETESLVEKALAFLAGLKDPIVVDVGTGSGCIAISIALNDPKVKIYATDISEEALRVAKKNALLNNVSNRIIFLKTNLISALEAKVDLILANLPYISDSNWEKLPKEIRDFEPKIALASRKKATTFYEKLFKQAKGKLSPKGKILYEIDGEILEKRL